MNTEEEAAFVPPERHYGCVRFFTPEMENESLER